MTVLESIYNLNNHLFQINSYVVYRQEMNIFFNKWREDIIGIFMNQNY